jgi:hypothetical protein
VLVASKVGIVAVAPAGVVVVDRRPILFVNGGEIESNVASKKVWPDFVGKGQRRQTEG